MNHIQWTEMLQISSDFTTNYICNDVVVPINENMGLNPQHYILFHFGGEGHDPLIQNMNFTLLFAMFALLFSGVSVYIWYSSFSMFAFQVQLCQLHKVCSIQWVEGHIRDHHCTWPLWMILSAKVYSDMIWSEAHLFPNHYFQQLIIFFVLLLFPQCFRWTIL